MKQEYTYGSDTPVDIRDLWQTPPQIFQYWNRIYDFDCDVAASEYNHLVPTYMDEAYDALANDWMDANWCNPPYSDIGPWVKKASEQAEEGRKTVMLIPANMDTKWFMEVIRSPHAYVVFLVGGRIRFIRADTQQPVGSNPRGSMFVIFDHELQDTQKFSYIPMETFNE